MISPKKVAFLGLGPTGLLHADRYRSLAFSSAAMSLPRVEAPSGPSG